MSLSYAAPPLKTPAPTVGLVVRPDQAHVIVSVSVDTDTIAAAVPVFQRAMQRLEESLRALGATVKPGHFELQHGSGKLASEPHASMQARVVLPLAKDASFWERAARLAQLEDLLRALVAEGKRQKPSLEVRKGTPMFVVAEPEAHRAELVKVLHARAQSLAAPGPVTLSRISFEEPVVQRSIGLEEVEVSLSLGGEAEFRV